MLVLRKPEKPSAEKPVKLLVTVGHGVSKAVKFSELSSVLDRSPNEGKSEKVFAVHLVFFAFAAVRLNSAPTEIRTPKPGRRRNRV